MNPFPDNLKTLINKEPTMINRLKSEKYKLELDDRIWTFPRFEPTDKNEQVIEELKENL